MQSLQNTHKDGPYSDMQVTHAGGGEIIAKQMGIEVLAFKFKETEVSEMEPTYPTGALKFKEIKRDETSFKQRLVWSLSCLKMGFTEQ
jgi:hypothetical protein